MLNNYHLWFLAVLGALCIGMANAELCMTREEYNSLHKGLMELTKEQLVGLVENRLLEDACAQHSSTTKTVNVKVKRKLSNTEKGERIKAILNSGASPKVVLENLRRERKSWQR